MNIKNQSLGKLLVKNPHMVAAAVVLCLFFTRTLTAATGTVDVNTRYQMIEGFGASGAWYENYLTTNTQREAIYDLIFNDLKIDIYRIRNTYDYNPDYMNRTATIVSEGLERNPDLKIMISSWSPPLYLKSTGRFDEGTLIGGLGNYAYDAFAQWWYDSIVAWSALGVSPYYINIQNEPDWNGNDRCLFQPTESAEQAGYDQAFETVWQKLYSEMGSAMPKMPATDHSGLLGANGFTPDQYLNAIPDLNHVYGYAFHLYNCENGGAAGCGDEPDLYIDMMTNFYNNWHDKPLMQTEYESATGVWPDALNVAWLMHNSLTINNVSVYLYWDLFWRTEGLITIPSSDSNSYTPTSDYYGFKHFSGFVHRGWQRIGAVEDSPDLRMSAYISPDYQKLSVVVINTSPTTDANLNLSIPGFVVSTGSVYRTKSDQNCVNIGDYNSAVPLNLPARSVTTLSLNAQVTQVQTLDVSATSGGTVTTPGTGTFEFPANCLITLKASPDIYYHFENWSDSAVTAGKVADPYSASTTVLMDANYTLVANFEHNPVDSAPPQPNPPVWASEPNAVDFSSITMTVAEATDANSPPVKYYFECVNDMNFSSAWQLERTYVASGLAENTSYSFKVKARDSYLVPNETNFSEIRSATTLSTSDDWTPPSPSPTTWGLIPSATDSNSILMRAGATTDISGVEYSFENLTIPDHNSGWQDSNSFQDIYLSPNTQYTYRVKARDKSTHHNETGWSTSLSAITNIKILHRFAGGSNDGANPMGEVLKVNSTLYGMTQQGGGSSNFGTIFKVDINGTGFQKLISFNGTTGWQPNGDLILYGSSLYGISQGGGPAPGLGVIFKINTNGSGYQSVHNFAGPPSDGEWPLGSLVCSGSTFYGMAIYGGNAGGDYPPGVLFKMNTNGSGYQILHNFTNGADGGYPNGTPLVVGSVIYGMTVIGGTGNQGVLFKVNTDGTGFQVLRNFNGAANNGGFPAYGAPIMYNGQIYGMTQGGGSANSGVFFRINTNGTGFTILHHFTGGINDGLFPASVQLAQSGAVFYGMAAMGGAADRGIVFQINADGTGFQILHSFTGVDGSFPMGTVTLYGSKLYGMAFAGGSAADLGSVFEVNVPPGFSNCPGVISAGYRLDGDISCDCYVNYADLATLVDNWLSGCSQPDNCHGADITPADGVVNLLDLSRFAAQWLWCNDPEDADCVHNW